MATKITQKKQAPPAVVTPVKPGNPLSDLADDYLSHKIYQAIVSYGEPTRVADIVRTIDDESISLGLVRQSLGAHSHRFLTVDRRWDVATRYLDRQRPALKILEELVMTYGAPMAAWDAAHEVAQVLNLSAEGQLVTAERLLSNSTVFFPVSTNMEKKYGSRSWLLDTQDSDLDIPNLLFYNYLPADALDAYKSLKLDWLDAPVEAAVAVLSTSAGSLKVVDNRLVQLLAYLALDDDYDGPALYSALHQSPELVLLPGHRWTNREGLEALRSYYREQAQLVGDSSVEEEELEEEAVPLTVSSADIEEIERILQESPERAVRAVTLLEQIYEIASGDRTFQSDLSTVTDALRAHPDKFLWVGYDNYRTAGTLPPYIGQVPETLTFPVVPQVENADGDFLDQLLEDDGFERGLEREILSPYAQDVNDQEAADSTVWPAAETAATTSVRCILKAHHKEIFTFPLCQIPLGFFSTEPEIVELTLRDRVGNTYQVYADYKTQLVYGLGLLDLYSTIEAASGAIFTLEKTSVPGEFLFTHNGDTDPDVYLSQERLEQLQAYRDEVENGPSLATFDIVRYLFEHSNQAMSFLGLLTEVNIVRRVKRRQLASIVSGWNGFSSRGGVWSFDAKKAAQGFNKAKRKYVIDETAGADA